MEEYLQNMKNLRSQMNDFEDQAANIFVEEEKQRTAVQTMEKDVEAVKSESKRLREETDRMLIAKTQIDSQILGKKRKILILETETLTLTQSLELLEQEKVGLSSKLQDKRAYYARVTEEMNAKLQEEQDWLKSWEINRKVEKRTDGQIVSQSTEVHSMEVVETDEKYKNLTIQLVNAQAYLEDITRKNSDLAADNNKSKVIVEQLKCRIDNFSPALKAMDIEALEEENKAVLSDKAGEMEYLQSLQERVQKIKCISQVVNCRCGREYRVELSN